MAHRLGSTFSILHGNPWKGVMRFALQLRTGGAPIWPLQFSFFGGGLEEGDKKDGEICPLLGAMREDSEELHLEYPETCYRELTVLDHVTTATPLYVFELIVDAPATLSTTEGAGVSWFTAHDLQTLHSETIIAPDSKFVMTPATKQVYRHLFAQGYFAKF